MEENNNETRENNINEEVQAVKENKHVCFENHCWKMCLGMVIAAFLGGFLATYFVADQIIERQFKKHVPSVHHPARYERNPFDELDRFDEIYEKNLRDFERTFENYKKLDTPNIHMSAVPDLMQNRVRIKTDFDDDEFKVIIGLRPFQNDADKVNYNVSGRKLTVYGDSHINDNGYEEDVSFSQDFILPKNADTANISKQQRGNKLVILVPLK